ncbi:MAG TPA: hypothetical protein VJW76_00620 [Verrucomicrobiae bacterium]|nr:hypothetical protein [Verrucomicrobiae bacterium]
MIAKLQPVLDQAVTALKEALGDNLYSCCVYGSPVRGNAIEGVSEASLLTSAATPVKDSCLRQL